ncbi:MAG: MFS transporter [Sphingomonadales bacterium]|nr:MFS transporter [Sphingomonadales bacterium]
MALVVLDAGIANIALPTIARAFAVTPGEAVLVTTAYQTALVMALLPVAALGDRLGCRKVFVLGVGLFTAGSVLCAVAPSLPLLFAARFLQGLGAAAVMALGVALLRVTVADGQLGRAIGWNALTVALAGASGPAVGALIISHAPWPWLFAINIPVGVLALVASTALPTVPPTSQRLDLSSMLLSATVFGASVTGAELGLSCPSLTLAALVTAAAALIAVVRREHAKSTPIIPIDLLRLRPFRLSVIASVLCFTGQAAALVALPFLLQDELHQTVLVAGLCMAAWPVSVAAMATISGRLADRCSTAWMCTLGATLLATALGAVSLSSLDDHLAILTLLLSASGVGFSLFNVPNNKTMFLSAPLRRSAAAGGLQATARLSGQTLGAVLMTAIFNVTDVDLAPRTGLMLGAAMVLTAGLVSMRRR